MTAIPIVFIKLDLVKSKMSKFPRYLPLYPLKWDASLCAPTEAPQAQSSLQNGIVDIM